MDEKRVAKELVKVAKDIENADAAMERRADVYSIIGDVFARYLVGDRDYAIKQLKTLSKKPFEGNLTPLIDDGRYLELFSDLQTELTRVVKKHLPV